MSKPENCIDVVRPFVERLDELDIDHVQIFGGIYSAALKDERTVIDVAGKQVIAPDDLYLPTIRDDSRCSLRDVDVLVQSSSRADIDAVLSIMRSTIGDKLELSAFGYKTGDTLREQLRNPLGMAAALAFVSDRFEDPRHEAETGDMVKSVFPFWVKIDPESLETWRLRIGASSFPAPNPVSSLINYTNRSISGIRPKDVDKVMGMAETIFAKAPELREWAIRGPGKSQVELGVLLRSLTPQKEHADPLRIGGVQPLTFDEMVDPKHFMVPDADDMSKFLVVSSAKFKAGMLHFGESNEELRSFYQDRMERMPFFNRIVQSGHGQQENSARDN
ncbi:hypothetical protein HGB25_01010 [Candidatus Saccharibacteria bacterium]|nr:hypothetical protein [Candidatus Saccharibacteria bacterium]